MPQFANPFPDGNIERKLTVGELIQAIRLDIAGELEAIYLYDAHINATTNANAKKVLSSIRDEEKIHMIELIGLLNDLDPGLARSIIDGEEEIKKLIKNKTIPE